MNNRMYLHPATQANLELLAQRGVTVIPPGEGELASHGEHGIGRLAEPAQLLAACEALLTAAHAGRACGCWSPPAARASRSTACASSATARRGGWASRWRREAARRGAEVTLVAANVDARAARPGVRVIARAAPPPSSPTRASESSTRATCC